MYLYAVNLKSDVINLHNIETKTTLAIFDDKTKAERFISKYNPFYEMGSECSPHYEIYIELLKLNDEEFGCFEIK